MTVTIIDSTTDVCATSAGQHAFAHALADEILRMANPTVRAKLDEVILRAVMQYDEERSQQ